MVMPFHFFEYIHGVDRMKKRSHESLIIIRPSNEAQVLPDNFLFMKMKKQVKQNPHVVVSPDFELIGGMSDQERPWLSISKETIFFHFQMVRC